MEKKIPPPLVAIICGLLMKWIAGVDFLENNLVSDAFELIKLLIVLCLILTGLFIDVLAIFSFRKGKTTINPLNPNATSKLVINGVYKISRNPMYLGLVLFLCAWGLYLSSVFSFLIVPVFIFYITRFQIIPEEQVLEEIFSDEFLNYKQTVRRWI